MLNAGFVLAACIHEVQRGGQLKQLQIVIRGSVCIPVGKVGLAGGTGTIRQIIELRRLRLCFRR